MGRNWNEDVTLALYAAEFVTQTSPEMVDAISLQGD